MFTIYSICMCLLGLGLIYGLGHCKVRNFFLVVAFPVLLAFCSQYLAMLIFRGDLMNLIFMFIYLPIFIPIAMVASALVVSQVYTYKEAARFLSILYTAIPAAYIGIYYLIVLTVVR